MKNFMGGFYLRYLNSEAGVGETLLYRKTAVNPMRSGLLQESMRRLNKVFIGSKPPRTIPEQDLVVVRKR